MPFTVDAVVDEDGTIRPLSPVRLPAARRAVVTILDDPADAVSTEEPTVVGPVAPWTSKYEPIRLLGEGGMGRVHLARDRHTGAIVCVKDLRGSTRVSALQQECRALARLNHPSILRIINFEARGDRPYLVTEHGRGTPMRSFMGTPTLAQEPIALAVLERLFDAAAYAHSHDVIHRDLKPDNVLLEVVEGVPVPKILDFGLAIVDYVDDRDNVTGIGIVAGTPPYMALEQLQGKMVSGACDVYAIGQMGCEMLSGKPEFRGKAHEVLFEKMSRDGLTIEAALGVSSELRDLLFACTRKDPQLRPSAEAAASAVRALLPPVDAQSRLAPANLTLSGEIGQRPAGWFDGLGLVAHTSTWYESTVIRDGDGVLCSRLTRPGDEAGDFAVLMERIAATHLRGTTVRLEARVRTDALTGWAGLWMRADGGARQLAFDNMYDRAIRGTTPWTDYAIELSIPDGTEWLNFGFVLDGGGAMFMRHARLSSRGCSDLWMPLGVAFGEADAHDAPTALLR